MTDNREEIEINLLELVNKLWERKKFILKAIAIGVIIGLVLAFSMPKEYMATVILLPEMQPNSSSSMGSLVSMAGINLGSNMGDPLASPDLYPNVFESTPFIKGLFDINVKDSKQSIDTSLYSYMSDYQEQAWWSHILKVPGLLIGLFSSKDNLDSDATKNNRIISKEEMDIIEVLKSRLIIFSDKNTAVTTIEVTMQSPEITAYLSDTLASYFQSYIINYRTQKARNNLDYTERLYEDSKSEYYKAQQKLAAFVDGNLNVVSAKFRTNQERLQNEVNLAYSVYNQTAQQLQLAKVKVQDETPVFMVIQPAVQPLYPYKPSKKMILIGSVFFALVISVCWVLRDPLKEIIIRD